MCLSVAVQEKTWPQKMIISISGFGFCPKIAASWRLSVFKKWFAETPTLIVVFGCVFCGPSCRKGENLDPTPHPPKKFWMITEEFIFGHFLVIVCLLFLSCFGVLFLEKLVFLLQRDMFLYLSMSSFVSLAFCLPSLFDSLFLCLSLVFFFSSFILLIFLASLSLCFFLPCLFVLFHWRTTSKY